MKILFALAAILMLSGCGVGPGTLKADIRWTYDGSK
jgi:hypothetical protein